MIEFILILSIYANAGSPSNAVAINALPLPFFSMDECAAAGTSAKAGLIEGMSFNKSVSFVCVRRTAPPKA